MDYLINIDSIQNKQNELNNLKTTIDYNRKENE